MTTKTIIKDAFSNFLIADMETPRDEYYGIPRECLIQALSEVTFCANRVGRKVRACAEDMVAFDIAAKEIVNKFYRKDHDTIEFVKSLVLEYNLDTDNDKLAYYYAAGVVDAWRKWEE